MQAVITAQVHSDELSLGRVVGTQQPGLLSTTQLSCRRSWWLFLGTELKLGRVACETGMRYVLSESTECREPVSELQLPGWFMKPDQSASCEWKRLLTLLFPVRLIIFFLSNQLFCVVGWSCSDERHTSWTWLCCVCTYLVACTVLLPFAWICFGYKDMIHHSCFFVWVRLYNRWPRVSILAYKYFPPADCWSQFNYVTRNLEQTLLKQIKKNVNTKLLLQNSSWKTTL